MEVESEQELSNADKLRLIYSRMQQGRSYLICSADGTTNVQVLYTLEVIASIYDPAVLPKYLTHRDELVRYAASQRCIYLELIRIGKNKRSILERIWGWASGEIGRRIRLKI